MKQLLFVLLACPLLAQSQHLQSVTDSGNTTGNLLQLTGAGKIPITGKGLELYGYVNDNEGIVQAFDRNAQAPMKLVLQPNTGSVTTIHRNGGRLLINGADDDLSAAMAVNGKASFSLIAGQNWNNSRRRSRPCRKVGSKPPHVIT